METKPQIKHCSKIKCRYGHTCVNGECVKGKLYPDEMLAQRTLYNVLFKSALHLNYICNISLQVSTCTAYQKERGAGISATWHAARVQPAGKREYTEIIAGF